MNQLEFIEVKLKDDYLLEDVAHVILSISSIAHVGSTKAGSAVITMKEPLPGGATYVIDSTSSYKEIKQKIWDYQKKL